MRELAAEVTAGQRERRLYDRDFWAWTQEQSGALRRRELGAIDWDNLIEEVETLGRSESGAWASLCANVISHLLKIEHSRSAEPVNHWRGEVEGWRWQMHRRILKNLGMKSKLSEMLGEAWEDGRRTAVRKLGEDAMPESWAAEKRVLRELDLRLPRECPYTLADVAGYDPFDKAAEPDADVWPPAVARRLNEALRADYPVRYRGPEREGGRSR